MYQTENIMFQVVKAVVHTYPDSGVKLTLNGATQHKYCAKGA